MIRLIVFFDDIAKFCMNSTLNQIRDFAQHHSPVFIVGAPRSGTSLLYRILQQHSQFKLQNNSNQANVNLVESNIFSKPYSLNEPNKLDYMLENRAIYEQFLNTVQGISQYQEKIFAKNIFGKLYRKNQFAQLRTITWKLTQSHDLIAAFFFYAQQARGVDRILEKTPAAIYHLPEINATFPCAKKLFIHRHPIDVFTSYRRRLKKSLDLNLKSSELRWLEISPERFCNDYESSLNLAIQASSKDEADFSLIAYTDLVERSQDTIEALCHFLEISFESQCLVKDERTTQSWEIDPYLYGGIQKTTKDWQSFIEPAEAVWIENRLQSVMQSLYYSRYSQQ